MRGRLARILMGFFLVAGCVSPTDPLGRQDALQEAQEKYTEFVRWGDVERAGKFVDPAMLDEFLRISKQLELLRITDFEIGDIEHGDKSAIVTVIYQGYSVATLIERTARERQEWYRDDGFANVWHVRPELAQVVATLRGAR